MDKTVLNKPSGRMKPKGQCETTNDASVVACRTFVIICRPPNKKR